MRRRSIKPKRWIHSFGQLFFRNLSLLICLILVPMLLVVWIAAISQRAFVEKELTLYNSRTVSLFQNSINDLFESCLQQANYLLSENDIELFLTSERDGYTFYHDDVLYKLMRAQMASNDRLESIYIYSDINGKFVSNYGETDLNRFFDTGWLEDYLAYTGDNSFFYVFRNGSSHFLQPIRILSLYKILEHEGSRKGVIVYNIDFGGFVQDLSSLRSEQDSGLSLRRENGELVENLWGEAPEEQISVPSQYASEDYWHDENRIVYRSPVQYTDLYLYSTISWNGMQSALHEQQGAVVWIVISGFLFVLILTIVISIRIYHPFKKILAELSTPAGLMSDRVSISRDEEAFILDSIRGIFQQNEHISEELSQRVALLKQAQSVALQSQINPHFLHNTLDSISWVAMRLTGGKNEASVMLSKLAQILRYSLDDVDTLVPLRRELENTRIYLELQAMRYKNSFRVEWEIQEDVLDRRVIKLMLQPIVENAIQHGLKPKGPGGLIRISAAENEKTLEICIRDNGVGILPERMQAIQAALRSDMIKQRENIGIANVHQRIQLFYGEQYGVDVAPLPEGTQVTLRLPLA